MGLGPFLAFHPDMRSDPKTLTFKDAVPGILAIIVGSVLIWLAVISVRKKK